MKEKPERITLQLAKILQEKERHTTYKARKGNVKKNSENRVNHGQFIGRTFVDTSTL